MRPTPPGARYYENITHEVGILMQGSLQGL